MIIDMLFMSVYSLFKSHPAYSKISKLQYRAAIILSLVFSIPVMIGIHFLGFTLFKSKSSILIILSTVLIIYLLVLIRFNKKSHLQYVTAKWNELSESERKNWYLKFFVLATCSFLLLIILLPR